MANAGEIGILDRLWNGSASAFASDPAGLDEAERWLTGVSARELLRIDAYARSFRWDGRVLGSPQAWTAEVLSQPHPAAAFLASMHHDGRVRERAVARLAATQGALADRGLAVRLSDHVAVIREAASRGVRSRVSLESAERIVSLLEHMSDRSRIGPSRELYLEELTRQHGEDAVWRALRRSPDRRLRLSAFRHSLDAGLIPLEDAVDAVRLETDPALVRLLAQDVADRGSPAVIASALLDARVGEARALGLVRLDARDVGPATLERLLLDRSVLVRLWARRRWAELGHDAAETYLAVARGGGSARIRARAYLGLRETGRRTGRTEALELARSGAPALARVGLRELVDSALPQDVAYLFGVVRTASNAQARLASAALIALRRAWSVDDLGDLASSGDPALRRRAWLLRRGLGGWQRTIADLEILADPEPALAAQGHNVAAPMYLAPTQAERDRIAELLARVALPADRRREIGFAAGLPPTPGVRR